MLTVNKLIPQARGLAPVLTRRAPTVELDWDIRQKSRFEATDSSGRTIGVFLPRGSQVRGGDVLVGEDGSLIVVRAAAQPVMRVRHCPDHGRPFDLLRAAYHLGNRHVPLELQPDLLQLEPDHVLAGLLRQMHLRVDEGMAPFEPEGGAYSAEAGSHGHAHSQGPALDQAAGHGHPPGHDHDHDHGHGHGHGHDHGHGHGHELALALAAGDASHRHGDVAGEVEPRPGLQLHQQHDHGHHDLSARRVATGPDGRPASTAPQVPAQGHVHGPGCGHDHSH